MSDKLKEVYLGDGLYASFDGSELVGIAGVFGCVFVVRRMWAWWMAGYK